ncbi:efflux RND transporter periplasmic adaptor subunit [Prolixibacter sp. NT017]|uniref:efflux RND transporter periplasmic adaptor subunit n=1 Tax=Prolixibacter sp. NT017 TaxID=2652390 RepID=UPI0012796B2E|nr:efflux RND transporter periplasmic adaptor subunit [Prolixibacter sp. NT017]GET25831.1 hemolysin D [Prolixibacter sp. NT017]
MNKKIFVYILLVILGAALGVTGYYLLSGKQGTVMTEGEQSQGKAKNDKKGKILYWRAPMNPNEIYNHPGKSAMGMDLVPVYADQAGQNGVVSIDPVVEQDMNVKTTVVKSANMHADVMTNGIIQPDEQKEYTVTTKAGGWIDKLYVNYTGQQVRKGQKLLRIYSPELVAAEQEYLTALAYDNAMIGSQEPSDLLKNATRKLELLDVSNADIQELKKTKHVRKYITLTASFDGTVLSKNVDEGAKIMRGMPLMKIANLSSVWLVADVYEHELNKIALGQPATITMDFLPGVTYKGKISFIYPVLDTQTRTIKVRIDLNNSNHVLKPGMFANVDIKGKDLGNYPMVPAQAILQSGRENTVIVSLGHGKFKPVHVKLGNYSDGYYQILSGLSANTKVVTSAEFMIDSESNLNASMNLFTAAKKDSTSGKQMKNMKGMKMDKDSTKATSEVKDTTIIRKGVINVEAIDKNHDGKLYEDVMDWNVISDKPGTCPICGMKLREMTIQQVKDNLKAHGFKYQ